MKKRNSILSVFAIITIVAAASFTTVLANGNSPFFKEVGADDYHLSLNNTNAADASDIAAGFKTLDQYTTISFTNASVASGGFIALTGGSGTLQKNEASNELSSITATFSGYVTIETSYASDFSSVQTTLLTSNELAYIHGNYWRIKALTNAQITSVDIAYGCSVAKERPTPLKPTGYAARDNYVSLQTINNEVFFVCDFTYAGSSAQQLADVEHLHVVCDMRNGQTDAVYLRQGVKYVKYTGDTTFTAYFSLTEWYTYASSAYKTNLAGSNYNWYDVHVEIKYNDQAFISTYLYNGYSCTTTTHLLADNLQMNIWPDGTSDNYIYFSIGKVINGFDAGTSSSLWDADFTNSGDAFVLHFKAYREQYQTNDNTILKKAFAVKGDSGSLVYPSRVDSSRAGSSGDYRLLIDCYFRFEDLAAATTETNVYIHLYFFGATWNGSAGDFKKSVWYSADDIREDGFSDTDSKFTYSGTSHNFTGKVQWNIPVIAISSK